jgi:2,3-bisphosphoglycerate-independent phosphoglycerate mutase
MKKERVKFKTKKKKKKKGTQTNLIWVRNFFLKEKIKKIKEKYRLRYLIS